MKSEKNIQGFDVLKNKKILELEFYHSFLLLNALHQYKVIETLEPCLSVNQVYHVPVRYGEGHPLFCLRVHCYAMHLVLARSG